MIHTGAILTIVIAFAAALSYGPCLAAEKSAQELWQEYRSRLLADPAIVAYYDFQEGAGDTLYNRAKANPELKGALHGAVWTEGRWPRKTALSFDGGAYAEIPHHASLCVFDKEQGGSGELTVEVWLYARTTQEAGIVDKSSAGWGIPDPKTGEGGAPFVLCISSRAAYGFVSSKTQTCIVRETVELATNEWIHLVMAADPAQLTLYRNGTVISKANKSFDPTDNGKPLLLGCMKPGVYHFSGLLDEVAIYRRALTADEVRAHFESCIELDTTATLQEVSALLGEVDSLLGKVDDAEVKEHLRKLKQSSDEKLLPTVKKMEARAALRAEERSKFKAELKDLKDDLNKVIWKARLSVLLKQL